MVRRKTNPMKKWTREELLKLDLEEVQAIYSGLREISCDDSSKTRVIGLILTHQSKTPPPENLPVPPPSNPVPQVSEVWKALVEEGVVGGATDAASFVDWLKTQPHPVVVGYHEKILQRPCRSDNTVYVVSRIRACLAGEVGRGTVRNYDHIDRRVGALVAAPAERLLARVGEIKGAPPKRAVEVGLLTLVSSGLDVFKRLHPELGAEIQDSLPRLKERIETLADVA